MPSCAGIERTDLANAPLAGLSSKSGDTPMQTFVVLATRERDELLARTLTSLAQCRLPASFAGTLVVENGTRAGAERVVGEAAASLEARYLFEPAGNKSRALNAALAHIDDGLIVFLDDDVRPAAEVIEAYAAAARATGPGYFFGGPVEPDYEAPPPDWLTGFLPPSARPWCPDDAQLAAKPFFLGFNWAAFASDLRLVGGFDERLGPGTDVGIGDESDLQRRLVASGLTAVCVRQALVHHWVPRVRCSPEWALQRAYRSGIRNGWLKQEDTGPAIAGYPLRLVKRVAGQWLRRHLVQPGRGPGERFAAQAQYHRQRGVLRGVMLRRRERAAMPAG
jgi:GT2 family glycosyltransferase